MRRAPITHGAISKIALDRIYQLSSTRPYDHSLYQFLFPATSQMLKRHFGQEWQIRTAATTLRR